MQDQEAEDRLDDARQHLTEASEHIAHAVQQLALQEHLEAAGGEGTRSERLHRRRDGLAVTYKRLQKIQDDLQTLQAGEAAPAGRWSH
jgi:hypothetical protein